MRYCHIRTWNIVCSFYVSCGVLLISSSAVLWRQSHDWSIQLGFCRWISSETMQLILIVCSSLSLRPCSSNKCSAANVVNIIMWSGIEACASTVCANLPCYGQLFSGAPKTASYIKSVGSSFGGSSKPYRKPSRQEGSASLEGIVTPLPTGLQTRIEHTNANNLDPDIELNQVQVRTTISAQSDRAEDGIR